MGSNTISCIKIPSQIYMSKINALAARHNEKLVYKINMGMFDLLVNLDEQIKCGYNALPNIDIKKSIIKKFLIDAKLGNLLGEIDEYCILATICIGRDKNNYTFIESYNLRYCNGKAEIYFCRNKEYVKTYNIDLLPYFKNNYKCKNSSFNELKIFKNQDIAIMDKNKALNIINSNIIKHVNTIFINKKFAQYNNTRTYQKSEQQGYNSIRNFNVGSNYIDSDSEDEGRPNIGDLIKAKEFDIKDKYNMYYHTKTENKGEPINYSSDEDMDREDIYRVNDDVDKEIRLYEKYIGITNITHRDKDRRKYLNNLIKQYNNIELSKLEKENLNKMNKIYK